MEHYKLKEFIDKNNLICDNLSMNPNAISLFEKTQEKINWTYLSKNPNAISLLEKNIDKIDWETLSSNPNAISLLEKNIDKINWDCLSISSTIFVFDYQKIEEICNIYKEELMQKCFHPKRLIYYLEKYNYYIGEEFIE